MFKGAALGILLAPKSGSETRDKLSKSLNDLGDSIKEIAAEQLDKFTEAKDKIVSKVKGEAKDGLDNLQDDIENA